jgi:transcriptional regulator with XRE-family HTH domain
VGRGRTERTEASKEFAKAFGESFGKFLGDRGMSQAKAAKLMGLRGRARLNPYCHASADGTRPTPEADVLYLACTELGFQFDYKGKRISASTLNGNGVRPDAKQPEQLDLAFDRQLELTRLTGRVSVSLRRPPGRTEVSVSLKAVS